MKRSIIHHHHWIKINKYLIINIVLLQNQLAVAAHFTFPRVFLFLRKRHGDDGKQQQYNTECVPEGEWSEFPRSAISSFSRSYLQQQPLLFKTSQFNSSGGCAVTQSFGGERWPHRRRSVIRHDEAAFGQRPSEIRFLALSGS